MKHSSPFQWRRMQLTDVFLLFFMVLLLAQMVYNLFAHEAITGDSNSLDTVLRTTASAIFGYFISGGTSSTREDTTTDEPTTTTQTATIGFQPPAEVTAPDTAPKAQAGTASGTAQTASAVTLTDAKSPPTVQKRQRQTVIVAAMGLASLVILIIARNSLELTSATIATLSQLRDFVSGSVGYLIGHREN